MRLQILCLVIATIAFVIGSQTVALAALVAGFAFGVLSTVSKVRDATRSGQQTMRSRDKRS
jgi:hypothetical protein